MWISYLQKAAINTTVGLIIPLIHIWEVIYILLNVYGMEWRVLRNIITIESRLVVKLKALKVACNFMFRNVSIANFIS